MNVSLRLSRIRTLQYRKPHLNLSVSSESTFFSSSPLQSVSRGCFFSNGL